MGPDEIRLKILKDCATAYSKPLFILLRKSLEQNRIPKAWKIALFSRKEPGQIVRNQYDQFH